MSFRQDKYTCTGQGSNGEHYNFCGGGVVLYNDNGLWVVSETCGNKVEYTDIGGKYNYNDGNIYACISRELAEETFHTIEVPSSVLKNVPKIEKILTEKFKSYLCLFIHTDALDIKIDRKEFHRARNETVNNNFDCKHLYKQIDLIFIPYKDLEENRERFSYRLKKLLKI